MYFVDFAFGFHIISGCALRRRLELCINRFESSSFRAFCELRRFTPRCCIEVGMAASEQ